MLCMKDTFCSYYTNSDEITSYMVNRLEIEENDIILEPSAGEGIFIDQILNSNKMIQIDALDINAEAIKILNSKYQDLPSITVRETDTLLDDRLDLLSSPELWIKQTDTLLDEQLNFFGSIGGHYNKVIGNPPYGAWQDYDKRAQLKKKYPGQYVKETYSLFLLRCISLLRNGGRLSFIIPDTYLFLNLHAKLRELLLTSTRIVEIITFPSKFFPGVSFGYSNLSIITLERTNKENALNNTVRIVQGFESANEFQLLLNDSQLPDNLSTFFVKQSDVLTNDKHRFILADSSTNAIINTALIRLGDIANIVTGFYTGDNKRFIRAADDSVKGSKNYEKVNPSQIFNCSSLSGIKEVSEGYIPYVKSASKTRYYREKDEWFVRWDEDTIEYYNSHPKSRFQNSAFYFKKGVAIPMVKASTIRAFYIENRVFDQSIVGIFPKDQSKILYVLALMNSDIVNELIHTINPTANNSANYIKQIPYFEPPKSVLEKINNKVKHILSLGEKGKITECEKLHSELNHTINELYSNFRK